MVSATILCHIHNNDYSTIFKTSITEISEAIRQIQQIPIIEGSNGLFDPTTIQQYTLAINGLNQQEAITLLQKQGLSKAQQEQILTSAGLLSTTQSLNATLVEEAILTSQISGAKAEAILSELGLIDATTGNLIATTECTVAEVAQALATQSIVGADAEAILSQLSLTTANTTATVSFTGLTTAIKANTVAIAKWLVTNPIGWCILAASAIYGLIKTYEALTVSEKEIAEAHKESVEKAKQSISEYEELKQELETIQQTYDDNKKRLEDLYKLRENQTITQAENDYLEELEGQNKKLRQQIEYKQALADIEAKEAEDDAVQSLNEKTQDDLTTGHSNDGGATTKFNKITDAEKIKQNTENINTQTADLKSYEKAIKEIDLSQEEIDRFSKALQNLYELEEKQGGLNSELQTTKETYEALLNGNLTYEQYEKAVSSKKETIQDLVAENGELLQVVEPLNDAIISTTGGNSELKKANDEIILNAKDAAIEFNEYTKSLQGTANAFDTMAEKDHKRVISFTEALNSSDYADVKEKLLALAKSGEITPETLSSTEEYNELLKTTGTSAESATNQILDMLSPQEKLSALSQGLNKLKTAYEEFKDENIGFVTAETLESLPDAFKNLPQFDLFSQIVGNPTSGEEAIQQAFNSITKAYLLSQDTLIGLANGSEHDIQSYIANLKQMHITNAEDVVNFAVQALNEENDLINGAQAELEVAYERHLEDRTYDYERYLQNQSSQNTALVNALGETYKGDYDNWCEALSAKAKAYNAFIKALRESGIVYDSSLTARGNADKYANQGHSANEIADMYKKAADADYATYQADKLENIVKLDLAQITTNFGTNYSSSSSDSSSATSTTPSEVTKEFNWIETYLEAFAKKTEKIMNKVSDYLSFKKNISTIKSAVKAVQKEISANEKALQNYQEQMNAVGLDFKYINKIKNGDLNIETITGYETNGSKDTNAQLIEKIEKYQELYSTYTSIEDTLEDLRNTEKEWLVKNLEYINEYYQKLSDLKNLAIDKKQDNIDLKEAQGKKVTTGDYNGLISNNESYIKSLRTTYKKTNAEFNNLVKNGTIEKDSNEWFEWTETLADISSEIIQAQINTEEWNDQIEDLNIQKYTDAVDKLKTKNDELNDVISERESLGLEVREKDYSSLIKNNDSQIKQLEKQNALLAEYQAQVQKGSERWKEFQNQIDSNNSSIRQLNQSTTELINNIANIPIEKRDHDLETSSDRLALLQKKYDNATSSKERKEILKLMEEEQKKQREINEQAKTTTKSNLSTSQDNLLNYKSKQQSKSEKSSADIKENEKYISSKQKEFNTLSKQESSLNKKISAIDQKIKNTKDKTLLKELKNQKKDYEEQLNEIQARKNEVSSQLTTANKNLEKSKAELKEAEKNVSTLSGFKEGEKIDTEGITDQETLKWVKEYNLALDACEQAEYDAAIADEEWTAQIRENAQKRLDLIKEEYEALIDLNNSYSDATNSFINMRKVQGNPIEDSLYEDLIRNSQKNVDLAYAEWQKHSEQMAQNDYSNNPEGYQKALAENNRLQQAWYESVKTAEEYLDTLMDSRIEALEEEKEKLQKLHELQERRYKLEEAKYNLEKAKQRTNLVYNGTEFVYQADAKSVKDAEKALEDAEYDELIHKIDDWIDAIEAAKENMNLYDADGNLLTNIDEIIEAAKAFGDNLLDGLSKLLESNGYTGGDVSNVPNIIAVRGEELIFTKEQGEKLQQKFSGISPVFADSIHLKPTLPAPGNVNAASHIEINMNGDMQFNEVQNVNDLSKAIVNGQLRNSMKRELGKRKI